MPTLPVEPKTPSGTELRCFGAFLSGVLGRLAVPLGMLFLVLLAVWTVFG